MQTTTAMPGRGPTRRIAPTRRPAWVYRTSSCVLLFMVIAVSIGGCSASPDWERANAERIDSSDTEGWDAIAPERKPRSWTGGVSAVASQRPSLPNARLQLPRVSPDGRWVVFLDIDDEASPASAESVVTGRGLGSVSLWLRGIDDEGIARNLAFGHAAWPTWSADSSMLAFISHDPDTGCALGLHDVGANRTSRLAVGLKKMLTPAIAPDGRRVAVSGYGEIADQAVLFVVDVESGQAMPGPPPTLGGAQLMPVWIDAQTLVFVELDERGGGLMRWSVGQDRAEPVAPLALPESIFDAVHLHAGVPFPVSPDGRFFTYYAPGRDRMTWVDLTDGRTLALETGDRAGTWWNAQWFLVAENGRLVLVSSPQSSETPSEQGGDASIAEDRPRMNLLPGQWVPLWADADQQSMLLVGQGDRADRFSFLQLWVITK
ncbi:MAG: hypothetical protein AAF593_04010 [Planctomycetota bacterium]